MNGAVVKSDLVGAQGALQTRGVLRAVMRYMFVFVGAGTLYNGRYVLAKSDQYWSA